MTCFKNLYNRKKKGVSCIPKKKTQKDIEKEMTHLIGDEYSLLSPYKNSKEKMIVIHNICGHKYSVNWNNFKSGRRCPNCSGRMTNEEFLDKVRLLAGNEYTFLEKYITSGYKIKVRHDIVGCGYTYEVTPNHFLKGRRCPKCWFKSKRKTNDEFVQEVYSLVGDEYLPISEYVSSRDKIELYHNECGKSYMVRPNEFLQGNRCPNCKRSEGEVRISNILKIKGISFIEELSFDGFVGEYNVPYKYDFGVLSQENELLFLIEFDGEQHFRPVDFFGGQKGFESRQKNDRLKDEYAKFNNIPLLRIPYTEIDRVEEIIDEYLSKYTQIKVKEQAKF